MSDSQCHQIYINFLCHQYYVMFQYVTSASLAVYDIQDKFSFEPDELSRNVKLKIIM